MNERIKELLERRAKFERSLIEKAWADPIFKKALVRDPKSAIKEALGLDKSLPDEISIEVLEESVEKAYLVLPKNPDEIIRESKAIESLKAFRKLRPDQIDDEFKADWAFGIGFSGTF